MSKWMTSLMILWLLACGGCGARVAESLETTQAAAVVAGPAAIAEAEVANVSRVLPAAVASRAFEDDPDGDGIANYRAIITDTFDAAGNLATTLREEDFEADGIIDSRVTTSYGK